MISQGNSDNQAKIAPERGLECVRSVDSGQSVEVIRERLVRMVSEWLTDGGGGGKIQGMNVYMEPYRQNRIIQGPNGKI